MPPLPPARVVRAVESVRAALQSLTRRLAPPPFALLELVQGAMVSQAIYVAAELRVAETLQDGPLTPQQIAERAGADADALHRLLRLLATYGIFTEHKDGRFALTPMARALLKDAPMSMYGIARLMGHPIHWEDWGHLLDAVRTGEPSLPKLRGMGAFEYLEANAEYGAVFTDGMGAMSGTETEPLLAAYDFARYATVVDFCGGRGDLLAGVLKKTPAARGILSDPRVGTNGAAGFLAEQGVSERCTIADGGLFDAVPAGGDAYILKHILHDWPEPQALEILRNVRKAMNPGGRLLVMEMVVPDKANGPHSGKLVDLWLMLLVGGKERTRAQYAELLGRAGFQLERVVQTPAAISIVEASAH
ncbi:methyltransferase [Streptomyces sp. Je 1-369]|uniref:methyltransferase n=1 Tax=Streptomyces sp. Je 1-369 TaxID=2966192 RepID=UPI0022860633|nr:methyltransferase [Streptomyces sp. Je 1-369]WAL93039.1 acetylserotonin O-methyltransferase [Streptomyces sp. Je 1-369]WAL99941.1 acetylserotonin O-methyltransferase [Streptomyces sp. Je 1-369]